MNYIQNKGHTVLRKANTNDAKVWKGWHFCFQFCICILTSHYIVICNYSLIPSAVLKFESGHAIRNGTIFITKDNAHEWNFCRLEYINMKIFHPIIIFFSINVSFSEWERWIAVKLVDQAKLLIKQCSLMFWAYLSYKKALSRPITLKKCKPRVVH